MTRPRPALVLVLVVVALSAALVATSQLRPATVVSEVSVGATVPVSSTVLVCPDAAPFGVASATVVTAVAPLLEALPSAAEQPLTVGPLEADASPLASVDTRGPAATVDGTDGTDGPDGIGRPLAVRASGALAPGLAATQVSTVRGGEVTGVAGATCGRATTEAWFTGLGTELGHRPRLSLINPEQTAAEADVVLYGPDGPIDAPALLDVVIPPGASVSFELDAVAPDLEQLAVEVRVQIGRVTAGIRDVRVDGLDSLGVDWVPPSVPPATRTVVPGVSGGSGPRLLQVLAPGDLDTRVQLRLFTPTGAITPSGLEEIEVLAGTVHEVDLAEVTGGEVSAVELTSDQPLIAGIRVVGDLSTPQEMAYTTGAAPLDGPAVATDVRAGDGWAAQLVLTADDGGEGRRVDAATPATVRLGYVDADTGESFATDTIRLSAGATVDVALAPDGAPERFTLVVTPMAGVVYAAVQLVYSGEAGAGFTILPLYAPQLEVDVPRVRYDLSTGLRPLAHE